MEFEQVGRVTGQISNAIWDGTTPLRHQQCIFQVFLELLPDWLVRERHIYGIGIDAPGLDIGNNKGNPVAHIVTLGAQVYNIENVANLDYLIKKTRKQTPFEELFQTAIFASLYFPSRLLEPVDRQEYWLIASPALPAQESQQCL
ncbi:hypothetical protein Ocin01_18736 [Orchesella cincta]|uniref:Uncharacterized protein n=1 Tax=Orchesella cincta TaxID=48709 RepID=A0A1D2M4P9_ORCCI|nr:hypothetical protein Ocin01_18736 [Orchesella cincta]